jgi:hypothetical protein
MRFAKRGWDFVPHIGEIMMERIMVWHVAGRDGRVTSYVMLQ